MTLMCEIEAILNNRPLTEISSDPADPEPLTPNHLLLLNAGITFPPGLFSKTDCYLNRRWKQTQFLVDSFWKRWSQEYLVLLQKRNKWSKQCRPHEVGDLVLVQDISLPRNQWPLGKIVTVHSDPLGNVRSAQVLLSKDKLTTIVRPIVKLILLKMNSEL